VGCLLINAYGGGYNTSLIYADRFKRLRFLDADAAFLGHPETLRCQ
jgi:hypothetical protein